MLYGSPISEAPCGRCGKPVGTRNISYKDRRFFHQKCLREYEKEMENRKRIYTAITGEMMIEDKGHNLLEY